MARRKRRIIDVRFLAVLTLAALLVRFLRIGAESLWLDEAYSLHLSAGDALSVLTGSVGNRHTPPFYYFLLHFWTVFGKSEMALRSLSAVLGAVTVPLVYVLGKDLVDRRCGRIGAVLAAFAPFLVYYGQEARGYTLLVALVVASSIFLRRYVGRGRLRDGAAFALLSILSLYTHYYGAFVLAAVNLYAVFELRREPGRLARWFAFQAVIALAFLPWLVNLFGVGFGRGQVFRRFLFSQVPYTFLRFDLGYGLLPLTTGAKRDMIAFVTRNLPLLGVTFAAFGVLLVRGAMRVRGRARRFLLLHFALPFVLAVLVSLRFNLISERYLIVAFPFYLLLIAEGGRGPRGRVASLALVAAVLIGFAGLGGHFFNPRAGKTEWREAAERVGELGRPGDLILLAPSFIELPFRYYYDAAGGGLPIHGMQRREEFDPERFAREWAEYGGASRFWLVVAHTEYRDFYLDLVGARAREVERTDFPKENGLTVALFEGRSIER